MGFGAATQTLHDAQKQRRNEDKHMQNRTIYPKGNMITFPLELTQFREEEENPDLKYLYGAELYPLQEMVSQVCDQMEYDGSPMYDRYPDKVTMQQLASSICTHRRQNCDEREQEKWLRPLVEVMLCNEMNCRREKRCQHKRGCKR